MKKLFWLVSLIAIFVVFGMELTGNSLFIKKVEVKKSEVKNKYLRDETAVSCHGLSVPASRIKVKKELKKLKLKSGSTEYVKKYDEMMVKERKLIQKDLNYCYLNSIPGGSSKFKTRMKEKAKISEEYRKKKYIYNAKVAEERKNIPTFGHDRIPDFNKGLREIDAIIGRFTNKD